MAEAESRKRRQQREKALAKQVNARTAVNDTSYLRASHAEKLMEFRSVIYQFVILSNQMV